MPEVGRRPQPQTFQIAVFQGGGKGLDRPQCVGLDVGPDLLPALSKLCTELGGQHLSGAGVLGSGVLDGLADSLGAIGGDGGDPVHQPGSGVGDGRHHRFGGVLDLGGAPGKTLRQTFAGIYTDLVKDLGGRVDAQRLFGDVRQQVHQTLYLGKQPVPAGLDALPQALDDVGADVAPLAVAAVPDAHQLCHHRQRSLPQRGDAVEQTVDQCFQQVTAAAEEIRGTLEQCARKACDQLPCSSDEGGQVVDDAGDQAFDKPDATVHDLICVLVQIFDQIDHDTGRTAEQDRNVLCDALHQCFQHLPAGGQDGGHGGGQLLGQGGHDLHPAGGKVRQPCGNATGKAGKDVPGGGKHRLRSALGQSGGQGGQTVGAPLGGVTEGRLQLLIQGDAQILGGGLQAVHPVLQGIRHGGIGGFGGTGAVLHLVQHSIEPVCAAVGKRQCAGACLHTGPQPCKGGAVAAHAVVEDLQHIPQTLALGVQLGKALAGLSLQNFAHLGPGTAQLVEHALGVGGRFGGGNAVGGHDCKSAGQVFHTDVVGGGKGNDTTHAGRQLVHAGLAQILGSQQHVRNMVRLIGTHAVGVQGGGQDIHRRTAGGKACCGKLCGFARKGNGVGGVLSGADRLICRLGNVCGGNAHIGGGSKHLSAQILHGQLAGIGNGPHLCKGGLKCGTDVYRRLYKPRHLACCGLYKVRNEAARRHGHGTQALVKAAGVQPGIAGNAEVCQCVHLSFGARAQRAQAVTT